MQNWIDLGRRAAARSAAVLALLLSLAPSAGAQRTFKTVGNDVKNAAGDIFGVWTAPFRADGRDWLIAGGVIAAGAAISPFDDDVDRWALEHPNAAILRAGEPFRENYSGYRFVDLPTGRRIWRINGALYAAGFLFDKPGLRDAGMGCFAAQQSNSILRTLVVYELVARDRPSELVDSSSGTIVQVPAQHGDQYEVGIPGGPWEQHSFFGGHVANAFACAGYVSERFQLGALEALPYAFAVGMTIARTTDRRHWLSDDVIGAAFGYAVGRVVAKRQLERRDARDRANRGEARVEPRGQLLIGNEGRHAYLVGWEFRFR